MTDNPKMPTPELVTRRVNLVLALGEARLAVSRASVALDLAESKRLELMDPSTFPFRKAYADVLNTEEQSLANLEQFDAVNGGSATIAHDLDALVLATVETWDESTRAKVLRKLLKRRLDDPNVEIGDCARSEWGYGAWIDEGQLLHLLAPEVADG